MPQSPENWIRVGKIKGAHALKGELWVLIFGKRADWLSGFETAGLGKTLTGPEVFCPVERAKPHGEGLRLKLKGIDDRTGAESLLNQYLYISPELLVSPEGEDIYLAEILGFGVFDGGNKIGLIESFSTNGAQDLLVVRRPEGGLVEIPFVKEFVAELDFERRELRMHLPEGLLEINS